MDLYDSNLFHKNDMKMFFIEMGDIKYEQFDNKFISNLSIIDLLMFNSKSELKVMLENYKLIRN